MSEQPGSTSAPFDRDARLRGGYVYTTNARLSSTLANGRLSRAVREATAFLGKSVLDIGCGDGTYTVELYETGGPVSMCAMEYADDALRLAATKVAGRKIDLQRASAYALPYAAGSFDVACLRGVLHHLDDPALAIGEALRVAREVVLIEPNGYNPVLKIIEKLSPYHREHGEKSYAPLVLDRWIDRHGGTVTYRRFAGLVPMFCPDWLAKTTKAIEPLVEALPGARAMTCAVYVAVARSGAAEETRAK